MLGVVNNHSTVSLPRRVRNTVTQVASGVDHIYEIVERPAESIKAIIQMLIGLVTVVVAIVVLVRQLLVMQSLKTDFSDLADSALTVVGVALAVSAVIELAYTFFTRALDEALDPLILGISSYVLIRISKDDPPLVLSKSGSIVLLCAAILVLFLARRLIPEAAPPPRRSKQLVEEAKGLLADEEPDTESDVV